MIKIPEHTLRKIHSNLATDRVASKNILRSFLERYKHHFGIWCKRDIEADCTYLLEHGCLPDVYEITFDPKEQTVDPEVPYPAKEIQDHLNEMDRDPEYDDQVCGCSPDCPSCAQSIAPESHKSNEQQLLARLKSLVTEWAEEAGHELTQTLIEERDSEELGACLHQGRSDVFQNVASQLSNLIQEFSEDEDIPF